jgi:hypothetical protein
MIITDYPVMIEGRTLKKIDPKDLDLEEARSYFHSHALAMFFSEELGLELKTGKIKVEEDEEYLICLLKGGKLKDNGTIENPIFEYWKI